MAMKDFIDERGEIRNIENTALIFSAAGSVRSNHLHKTGWHYLQVLHGRMVYRERPAGGGVETVIPVSVGGVVFTGPGLEHRTEFPEDTLMISYGSKQDDGEHERDTVPVEW